MRVGQASVRDLIGIVVYLVPWYFFFRLLVGLLPPSAGRRTVLVVGAALFALGGALERRNEAGDVPVTRLSAAAAPRHLR
jgi:hypothetical protein